jgi:hypothetical protein
MSAMTEIRAGAEQAGVSWQGWTADYVTVEDAFWAA